LICPNKPNVRGVFTKGCRFIQARQHNSTGTGLWERDPITVPPDAEPCLEIVLRTQDNDGNTRWKRIGLVATPLGF
jgi:hypothetical protein